MHSMIGVPVFGKTRGFLESSTRFDDLIENHQSADAFRDKKMSEDAIRMKMSL